MELQIDYLDTCEPEYFEGGFSVVNAVGGRIISIPLEGQSSGEVILAISKHLYYSDWFPAEFKAIQNNRVCRTRVEETLYDELYDIDFMPYNRNGVRLKKGASKASILMYSKEEKARVYIQIVWGNFPHEPEVAMQEFINDIFNEEYPVRENHEKD